MTLLPAAQVSGAYLCAIEHKKTPTVLALSRQNLPHLAGSSVEAVAQGGYTLVDTESKEGPEVILVASGSEVSIAVEAAGKLKDKKRVRPTSLARMHALPF